MHRSHFPAADDYREAACGYWSWIPGLKSYEPGFRLLRRRFHVASARRLVFYTCADCRYRFFLDGVLLADGPVKSPVWYKQLYRSEAQVEAGDHVLSAEVVVWGDGWFHSWTPFSEMHLGGGFYLSCPDGELSLSTPSGWKGAVDPSRRCLEFTEAVSDGEFLFATARQETDFAKSPGDWQSLDFDDSAWQELYPLDRGPNIHGWRLMGDTGTTWAMEMPQVSPMKREPMGLSLLDASVEELDFQREDDGTLHLHLPAGKSQVHLAFDRYFTGFLRLSGTGARGTLRLRQSERAEELRWQDDILLLDGRPWRMETFEIRAAGCLRLVAELETPQAITLNADFASYDFGTFREYHSPDAWKEKLYQVCLHTARCCAHDTYEDCPFFERFQYEGDTRIQALISYECAGNGELGRKALLDFQRSQAANGLLQSRFPSCLPQYIPGYSLFWILMVDDYLRYFPDAKLLHQLYWCIQGVLRYYTDLVDNATGLAGHPGYWAFTDWVKEWPSGDPSRDEKSPTAQENFLFAMALQTAARLADQEGRPADAREWRELSARVVDAANRLCWDEKAGLYADVPGRPYYSRHSQALAVLAGAASGDRLEKVHRALLEDRPEMCTCSLYFQFYVLEALRTLGDRDGMLRALESWRQCLEKSPWITTFPEVPGTHHSRSMCHAWSASPAYFLLKCNL